MSKKFNGIAIAKELGKNVVPNSSVLNNSKGILYAKGTNKAVYYDINLELINTYNTAPTKKFVASMINSPTVTYKSAQGVKYVDISVGSSKEQYANDWIILHTNNFPGAPFTKSGFDNWLYNNWSEEVDEGCLSESELLFVCNPGDPDYIIEWNDRKYYKWQRINGDDEDEYLNYFITTIADYDVLVGLSMQYRVDNGGEYWSKDCALSLISDGEFDNDESIINYCRPKRYAKSHDLRITNVTHFQGLYFKTPASTCTIRFSHTDGDVTNNPNIQYSKNFGLSWTTLSGTNSVSFTPNEIIFFKGNNPNGFNHYDGEEGIEQYSHFVINGGNNQVEVYGNPVSLVDNGYCSLTTLHQSEFLKLFDGCAALAKANINLFSVLSLSSQCYYYMFYGCTSLTEAPELPATSLASFCYSGIFYGCTSLTEAPKLPAMILSDYCYSSMFNGCTSLTKAPKLPATTLASSCYSSMFYGCTNLTTAPKLPATTLADYCYNSMFRGCTNLTEAPELPATTLDYGCYYLMFYNCVSLTEAPELPATTVATRCYYNMFNGCTSLTKAPKLPATTLASYCYIGMFLNCTSLTEASELPANTLATYCYNSMFLGCISLTEAPKLPATTLATLCYYGMFRDCTSLTEAPALLATSLVTSCYSYMFYGCVNLVYVNCLAQSNITTSNCSYWLYGVAPLGTFILYTGASSTWTKNNVSGIPANWSSAPYFYVVPSFTSIHIYQGTTGAKNINITCPKLSSNHTLEYKIGSGSWTTASTSMNVNISGTLILYLRGTLSANNDSSNYTNIKITSSNNSKAILSGNCNMIWNYSSPSSNPKSYAGWSLFENSTALYKIDNIFFSAIGTVATSCYTYMFRNCTNLTKAPNKIHATTLATGCYLGMFYGCTSLTEAPELSATTLVSSCYDNMFYGCTSLTGAPVLSSTTLASSCYYKMFLNCTSLTSAPELPATSLATLCYYSMFEGCTSLTSAPELPATSLATSCYYRMFLGCTSLTEAPKLPATSLATSCYYSMFYNCTNLTEAPVLPATTLVNGCYSFMFYSCSKLLRIYCNATSGINSTNCNYWVRYIASTGTFYKNSSASWSTGEAGIPSGWSSFNVANIASEPKCIEIRLYGSYSTSSATIAFSSISSYHTILYKDASHSSWTTATTSTTIQISQTNPVILLKGSLSSNNASSNYTNIKITSSNNSFVEIVGNCNYLWNEDNTAALKNFCGYNLFKDSTAIFKVSKNFLPKETISTYCYDSMFSGCTNLTEAPELPATTLTSYCYYRMFLNCSNLLEAPELPATTLVDHCYFEMFNGCTSLTKAPELPATTLASLCYYNMFNGCTRLTEAPELPATILVGLCYYGMFNGCTRLTEAPELPATTLASYCYYYMFNGCTSLTKAPELSATTIANSCYESMFRNCTSLTDAPILPATTLANYCYSYMFYNCTSLTTAPVLPATTAAPLCYLYMFYGCTNLIDVSELPATTLATYCYFYMFSGCTSLTEAPELPATTSANYCYSYMFSGCTNLHEVICFITNISGSYPFNGWLNNTQSGTVYCKNSSVPITTGWSRKIF